MGKAPDHTSPISRRDALRASGLGMAGLGLGSLALMSRAQAQESGATAASDLVAPVAASPIGAGAGAGALDLSDIPIFCGHEHWGSVGVIGFESGEFRADMVPGAEVQRPAGILDLVLDPHFGAMVRLVGGQPARVLEDALGLGDPVAAEARDPAATLRALRPTFESFYLTGAWQCLRRGILATHGYDLQSPDDGNIHALAQSVRLRYDNLFPWIAESMRKARLTQVIRPVHVEYYLAPNDTDGARREGELIRTTLRIDDFMSWWRLDHPRREIVARAIGVDPDNRRSWGEFLDRLFERARDRGAVGIKQMQAYRRSLDFPAPTPGEVVFRGDLSETEQLAFQNWVLHECCNRANALDWSHQIHVGTHNLPDSSPLPLEPLARRYGRMRLVLLHGWPYLAECGFLARTLPNVYLDPCWLNILNTQFLDQALRAWLGYVAASRIMISQNATSIEMAVGSAERTRQTLGVVLGDLGRQAGLEQADLRHLATDMLHNTAVEVYGIGEKQTIGR